MILAARFVIRQLDGIMFISLHEMHPLLHTRPILAHKKKASDQIVQRVRHHTPL